MGIHFAISVDMMSISSRARINKEMLYVGKSLSHDLDLHITPVEISLPAVEILMWPCDISSFSVSGNHGFSMNILSAMQRKDSLILPIALF